MAEDRQPWTAPDESQADADALESDEAASSADLVSGLADWLTDQHLERTPAEEPPETSAEPAEDVEELLKVRKPRQLEHMSREELEGAFLRLADYTRKMQGVAEMRRQLENALAEVNDLRQQLASGQPRRAAPAAAEGPAAEEAAELEQLPKSIAECVDADGLINLEKLEGLVRRRVLEAVSPLQAHLAEAEQRDYQEELERTVKAFEDAHRWMASHFPHYAEDEAAQEKVAQAAQALVAQEPSVILRAAYAVAYPKEYAEAVLRQAERRRQQAPPTTVGRASEAQKAPPPLGSEEFVNELARELAAGLQREIERR